tara:strand:- start:347 stop:460 length:114 start_codon:yes stop_codon:yes gene_type:complete
MWKRPEDSSITDWKDLLPQKSSIVVWLTLMAIYGFVG